MSKVNSKYIKTEDFSIKNLEEFEDENLMQIEILYTDSGKIKAKPYIKKTKLKHFKSPVNQYPAYYNEKSDYTNVRHIYLDIKSIELNNYLLNFSRPFILNIDDSHLHKFLDDSDYIADRDGSIQVSNGWFYIYFGLTSENKLDIKISSEEPYRYNGQSEVRGTDYYFGNDPLYLYKNSTWYRCVSCVHMGTSDLFSDEIYYGIYPRMQIIDNRASFDLKTIYTTTNTTYHIVEIPDGTYPKNLIRLKHYMYRGFVALCDREENPVLGSRLFTHDTGTSVHTQYNNMEEVPLYTNKLELRCIGGTLSYMVDGFIIQ